MLKRRKCVINQPRKDAQQDLEHFKKSVSALAGVAQWIECQPANQGVASLFPSLGHKPGLQARSPVGGMQEATTH